MWSRERTHVQITWNKGNKWYKSINKNTLSVQKGERDERRSRNKKIVTHTIWAPCVSHVLKCDECLHDLPLVINDTDLLNNLVTSYSYSFLSLSLSCIASNVMCVRFIGSSSVSLDLRENERALLWMIFFIFFFFFFLFKCSLKRK